MRRNSINILGMRVDMVQIPHILAQIKTWIKERAAGKYICISNADSAVWSKRNIDFRNAVNNSGLSVPDGKALVLINVSFGNF